MSPFPFLSFLCISIILSYGIFSAFRMHGLIVKSAQLVAAARPFERKVSASAPHILFMGDSTGVGVGAIDSQFSIAGRFAHDFPEWNIENISLSGEKTAELIPILKNLTDNSYSSVVVQIGGNDITRFTSLSKLRTDIETVLREADRVSSGQVILLTSGNVGNAPLLPRPFAFLWEHRTLQVRALFQAASRKTGIIYVDLFKEKSTDPFALDPYRYHAADLFHPSADGYALWYDDFKKAVPYVTL